MRRLDITNRLVAVAVCMCIGADASAWPRMEFYVPMHGLAERHRKHQMETALLLARTCVAEISFQNSPAECAAMWWVNRKLASKRRRSIVVQTRKFNSYWKSPEQRARRPWIAFLELSQVKPKLWPKRLSWGAHRVRWATYVQASVDFVDGKRPDPCPPAFDYGAPGEIPQGAKSGYLRKIQCLQGETLQWYWGTMDSRIRRRAIRRR